MVHHPGNWYLMGKPTRNLQLRLLVHAGTQHVSQHPVSFTYIKAKEGSEDEAIIAAAATSDSRRAKDDVLSSNLPLLVSEDASSLRSRN